MQFKREGKPMASLEDMHKKVQSALENSLEPGEHVAVALSAEQKWGLVATDRRVFIVKWGNLAGSTFGKQVNSWNYAQISGLEDRRQMTSRALILQVPGANPVVKFGRLDGGSGSVWEAPNAIMVDKKSPEVDQAVTEIRRLIGEHQRPNASAPAPSNSSASSPADDSIDQLRRLAQLRDEGVLTEEEFSAKKAQILGL